MNRFLPLLALAIGMSFAAPATAQDEGIRGELERVATTSPEEKREYANSSRLEINDAVEAVTKMLEQAKRDNDAEKIECLTKRLTALRALSQVTEVAGVAMNDALDNGENERADHEFRKIAVALAKTRQLLAEAEGCIDQSKATLGNEDRSVEGGPTADADDTEGTDEDTIDVGEDPPDVSPFQ